MQKIKGLDCILLVDDDLPTNFVHQKIIEAAQIDTYVHTTTSAMEALEYLTSTGKYTGGDRHLQPGIILLDINMPGMNGWDFLDEYVQLDGAQKARIVVIMVTSSINPADKERAAQHAGITSFLNKPLTVPTIRKVVDDYFTV